MSNEEIQATHDLIVRTSQCIRAAEYIDEKIILSQITREKFADFAMRKFAPPSMCGLSPHKKSKFAHFAKSTILCEIVALTICTVIFDGQYRKDDHIVEEHLVREIAKILA